MPSHRLGLEASAAPSRSIVVGHAEAADFMGSPASSDARLVANWVVASGDNSGLPFIIIDKIRAKVFVFDGSGHMRGATFALLGAARGDDTVPGIGSQPLATIGPGERTTPAGRFVASLGRDLHQNVLWVDYRISLSLHPVVHGNPGDRRLERLASRSPLEARISYGCINVPARFFDNTVQETFRGGEGIVYILPEVKPVSEVFPAAASLLLSRRQNSDPRAALDDEAGSNSSGGASGAAAAADR